MSQCIVPNWNLRHQRQEHVERGEGSRSSHVNNTTTQQQNNLTTAATASSNHHLLAMSNYELALAELTWQNGQLAMHGLGGLQPNTPTKPTWGRSSDTLESVVHQGTCQKESLNLLQQDHKTQVKLSSMVPSSGGKRSESCSQVQMVPSGMAKKRSRPDSDQCGGNIGGGSMQQEIIDRSACASASATICRDNDTTMMTWASFESPRNLKAKTTDEDSASHGGSENLLDEDQEIKGAETGRCHSSRRSRAADVHNQSERRRRDRINQKMKALQRLVPNASKTDKASMLDEVIDYLKQLQAQVQMMSSMRNVNMPQMMMPLGMHQQLQMSLLARMAGMGAVGLGMGMGGMLDINSMAAAAGGRAAPQSLPSLIHHPSPVSTATAPFVPSPFIMTSMMPPQPNPDHSADANASVPLPDPYCAAFLAQSMNVDLYNKMAALYSQQGNQSSQLPRSGPPQQSNHVKD